MQKKVEKLWICNVVVSEIVREFAIKNIFGDNFCTFKYILCPNLWKIETNTGSHPRILILITILINS